MPRVKTWRFQPVARGDGFVAEFIPSIPSGQAPSEAEWTQHDNKNAIDRTNGWNGRKEMGMMFPDCPEPVQSIPRRKRYDEEGKAVSGRSAVYFKVVKTRLLVED